MMISDKQREWERQFRIEEHEDGYYYISTDVTEIYLRQLYLLAVIADNLNAMIRDNY